jgi:probable rRNA maturation factor
MNKITFDWKDIEKPKWADEVVAFVGETLLVMCKDNWEVSLLFCGDEFIHELNREYRVRDEPTDVLSFPMGELYEEGETEYYLAGDIVISLPALRRNANEFGVNENEELARLLIHGLLHLSGMDHEDNEPSQPMLTEQEEILARIRIPAFWKTDREKPE